MNYLDELYMSLSGTAVFRGVLKLRTMTALLEMLRSQTPESFGCFVHALYRHGTNLSDYIIKAVTEDENSYLLKKSRREDIPQVMARNVERELDIFREISLLTAEKVKECCGYEGYIPEWENTEYDFRQIYSDRMDKLFTKGYGIFAKYNAFMLRDHVITPIFTPDPQRLSQLPAYETQRGKVIDNTLALLRGRPAANCLLYGDAGTGKSSTVKAVVNEFSDKGLRLIELKKSQLHELPAVMESIAENPLKFIIFIDDLSFSSDDEDFGALKAVLEGSAASKASNAVIYATSNRRHLVKESFSDRSGDDIHARDTREELASLSERFGLKVTFLKPDKDTYLTIVDSLAEQYGIVCDKEELHIKAEAYALRRSGRSGRAARHFIEMLKSEE